MDFFHISMKETRNGFEIRPDFTVGRSKDLMVRGQSFYAVWNEERGVWSTDDYDLVKLVDKALYDFAEKQKADGVSCVVKPLRSFNTGGWAQFRKFMKNVSDNSHQLDAKLTFANTEVKKADYVSKRLPYALVPGEHKAWDELVGTLYSEEERAKIEWAIGAVVSGDSPKIEKFLVFYGPPGAGKGTILQIIFKLFGGLTSDGGYCSAFVAQDLVGINSNFATEAFKDNPLVAIQFDGDLSKIEDNSKLNSIISHEPMRLNEKFKPTYTTRIHSFLFMGTNTPVRITDAKSGIIRRLIDVMPSGNTLSADRYYALMSQIDFELGAIAHHCLEVYRKMGKNAYSTYRPVNMMFKTNVFFNFIEAYYDVFREQNGTSLKQAWEMYKEYCKEAEIPHKLQMHKFREELKNYFEKFHERSPIDGARSYFEGFTAQPFKTPVNNDVTTFSLVLDETESLFDENNAWAAAQYAKEDGTPEKRWSDVKTMLGELDTTRLHYVEMPENHIVIDFDLKDENGEKSLELNLVEASTWPPTYAEISKSGAGVHLHYLYDGDTSELANKFSDGIEVKVFRGDASLRRKLTKCNNIPVATINSGLPFKEKKMLSMSTLRSEKGLRDLIGRNLRKEIHPGTKSSVDFIKKILDDAYISGMPYDVTDLRPVIIAFASRSRNQALTCLKTVQKMKFKSEEIPEANTSAPYEPVPDENAPLVFFDVEVYPNLFVVCWKYEGDASTVRMINPVPQEIEKLFKFKLVGFNNRRYDNHILWGRFMGHSNEELYRLSQKIINSKKGDNSALFSQAFDVSYADIYEFSSKKQGLKKFQIDLGITHKEMDIPWDEPVPEDKIMEVVEYCVNDVMATEAVFNDRKSDFVARQILADLSGLPENHTTRQHVEKIIFGGARNPQEKFVYTDLSELFPGYKFDEYSKLEKSTYRGEVVGEGGYVYAEPGIYHNVALLDVASMHPTSIEELNLFGPYTKKFSEIKAARLAIKRGDYSEAKKLLDGKLKKYIEDFSEDDEKNLKGLDLALKLVINSVYGFTSATFPNAFRDPRNKDNIVAKRGALFMIELLHAVHDFGYNVVHIKTDSIKIPDATPEIIEFIKDFGKKYGYTFEHEATYQKFCLVNDAVYVAKKEDGTWTATGAQFQHPYVFKTLFSGEPLSFKDLCETKSVSKGVMYLDCSEETGNPESLIHVGRTGQFIPVTPGHGGGHLIREADGKRYAVTGTKDYLWLDAEVIRQLNGDALDRMPFENLNDALEGTGSIADIVDMTYFERLQNEAIKTIEEFGDFQPFSD